MNVGGPAGQASVEVESFDAVKYNRDLPPPYSPFDVATASGVLEAPVRTIIVQPTLRRDPTYYTCPSCLKRIITRVEYVTTRKTHMLAGFVCGFTFWCMLCCLATIPYLTPSFKKAVHYCPNCKMCLGSHSRL